MKMKLADLNPNKTYIQAKLVMMSNDVETSYYMLRSGQVTKISDTKFFKLVDDPDIVILGPITITIK